MDTKESIEKAIKTLVGFNKLIHDRAKDRGNKRLDSWIVLGRWNLDGFGQVGTYSAHHDCKVPIVVFPDLPPVMTVDEYQQFVESKGMEFHYWMYGKAHGNPFIK